jgi:replicative DNA helicase
MTISDMPTTEQPHYTTLEKIADTLHKQRDNIRVAERGLKDGEPIEQYLETIKQAKEALARLLPTFPETEPQQEVEFSQADLLDLYWDQVKTRANVVSTGFARLDSVLSGGLEPGRLVGVLGAPNCGKTTFTHQIAETVASLGRPVLYVTSEDSPGALLGKTIARIGDIDYTSVLKGSVVDKIDRTIEQMRKRPSANRLRYLDATGSITMSHLENAARKHFEMYPTTMAHDQVTDAPGVLIIDYLQNIANIMRGQTNNQELRVYISQFTRRLHDLARELNCTVIIIASQNRENYTRSSSTGAMASAKESGDIEYACDVLIALNEDRDKNRVVALDKMAIMLYVDKNRQGQRNKSIPLTFTPDRQMFEEEKGK